MNTAEYLIKKLEELGINDFFGLPGDYNFNILNAINNNPNTNWIGCTNELNAGYSADGYARQRGYGAVVTTYGVGELSAINAIAGSYAENVPVITIVGTPPTKCLEDKTLVHHNLWMINTKAFENAHKNVVETTTFLNRDNAKLEIDRVLKVFTKEKRPVYIAIPLDIAKMEISDRETDYEWTSDKATLETAVAKIARKIQSSLNPIILGDILIKRYDAKVEFKEFVEKSGIPATNFLMGTGLLNNDCPNYLGTYFGKYKNQKAQERLENTDCLIAVGAIYSDLNASGFNLPYKINSHIAIYGTYTYIEGERFDNIKMADVLEGLTSAIETKSFNIEKHPSCYEKSEMKEGELTCEYIYPRLQEFIKENDIIITETGTVTNGVAQMKFPDNIEFHAQTLWGSIGWATPAAFGACIANPNKRVILITGEGAHQLTGMELGNMIRHGLKPVIIVINNNGYSIERLLSDNPDDKFNDIVQINYSKFARVFEGEVWSTKVTTPDDFDKALKVTQIMNKLCYIEICTAKDDVPELTKNIVLDLKRKAESVPEAHCKKAEEIKLSKPNNMNFGTTVHESLIIDEE